MGGGWFSTENRDLMVAGPAGAGGSAWERVPAAATFQGPLRHLVSRWNLR